MNWTTGPTLISSVITLCLSLMQTNAQDASQQGLPASSKQDSIILKEQATRLLRTYCCSCHGTDKQEGDVQLNAMESIDAVGRQSLLRKVQDVIHMGEMPPEDASQPKERERKILLKWLDTQLTGKAAKALAEKLQRFEYGNVVNHKDLFSR